MSSVTIHGGTKASHIMSPAERHAAAQALSKLTSTHAATAKALTLGAHPATVSGGVAIRSAASVAHASTVAGSFGKPAQSAAHGTGPSADTISVSGHTAAAVKGTEAAAKTSATITLSDKTTVTVSGVPTHNLTKPH